MASKLVCAATIMAAASARYNILSLDSAQYKGVMTANFVEYMERKAYLLAEEHKCVYPDGHEWAGQNVVEWRGTEADKQKISMAELFDMIAGSETGAIIASTLALKNNNANSKQKNKFFADKAVSFFDRNQDSLYMDSKMPAWGVILITALASILVGIPVFLGFEKCFNVQNFQERSRLMRDYHHHCKELAKRQPNHEGLSYEEIRQKMSSDKAYVDMVTARTKLTELIGDDKKGTSNEWEAMQQKILTAFQSTPLTNEEGKTIDNLDRLNEVGSEMDKFFAKQNLKLSYKWVALLFSTILVVLICYGVITFMVFLFSSNRLISELEKEIITDKYIPAGANIIDGLAKYNKDKDLDMLLISWDVNNRTPRLFSRWSYQNVKEAKNTHHLPLGQMTVASAATPLYFLPAKYDDHYYISGENVASSPAMFAYLTAVEKNNVNKGDIRVVSVGSTNQLPDRIEQNVGLLDWAQRLLTLNSPVKQHTMDYMTNFLLKKDGHIFHKFQIDTSADWESQFYFVSGSRKATLKQKSQEMIYTNMWKINRVLAEIVSERFKCENFNFGTA